MDRNVRSWMRLVGLAGWVLLSSSCQQIQTGNVATPLDARGQRLGSENTAAGIVISGRELPELSSPQFGALEMTFENRSHTFAHLDAFSFRFGPEAVNRTVFLPIGADLSAWSQAALERDAIRRNNTELALGLISTAAFIAGHGQAGAAGAAANLVALSSLGALAITAASEPSGCGPERPLFPPNHLLAGPISVPPGLFARRWVVFYTPDSKASGCLRRVQLGYRLEDGRVESVLLDFRNRQARSEWQAEACDQRSAPR